VVAISKPDHLRGLCLQHTLALDRERVPGQRAWLSAGTAGDRWSEPADRDSAHRTQRDSLMRVCVRARCVPPTGMPHEERRPDAGCPRDNGTPSLAPSGRGRPGGQPRGFARRDATASFGPPGTLGASPARSTVATLKTAHYRQDTARTRRRPPVRRPFPEGPNRASSLADHSL
jgi:hypothetical protein